jgi:uncharacterized protein (TIGR03435 family)
MKSRACAFVVVVMSTLAWAAAQELTPTPAFEVAAIAEVQRSPQVLADIKSGALEPRMRVTQTRLSITFLSLREIVRRAYEVEYYQMDRMSAPEWTGQTRWNIHATIPAGVTREQVPAMLRRLLAERFDLVVRLEPRPFPVYALVVGSGGARLRETEADAAGADRPAGSDSGTPDAFMRVESETSDAVMKLSAGSDGTVRVDFIRMPMSELASFLSEFVDRPMVDRTGLTGLYDFALEVSSDLPLVSGLGEGFGARPGAAGPEPGGSASTPSRQNAAVRSLETIGLALETRREPIPMVIVENVERVPAPN